MGELTTTNDGRGSTSRIEHFQSLEPGQYWKALQEVTAEHIEKDEVLLITSVRLVDKAPHTIILRAHPSKHGSPRTEHRFLVNEFINVFEYEPDSQRIRQNELQAAQARVQALQTELIQTQQDPDAIQRIIEEGLREEDGSAGEDAAAPESTPAMAAGTSIERIISKGVTEKGIAAMKAQAERQHKIASIQADWILSKTDAIGQAIRAMTPYYQEQAAASLAATEQAQSHIKRLMDGIGSLDLYVGKDVEVHTIMKGLSAAETEPLSIVQQKLFVDEECSVWLDVDEWFDWKRNDLFFKALGENETLLTQILPTPRCVVMMATTRRTIHYTESAAFNDIMNANNRYAFLLVRDGENIYQVCSPVESHGGARQLFPDTDSQDNIFRGVRGEEITFDDIRYTDRLSEHDRYMLHYKRFLILLCGLDHRLQLFGDFYPGGSDLNFISMAFQSRYMQFIHDDDGKGMMPKQELLPVRDWIKEKNAYLRSGSRVFCHWERLMNYETAPGACRRGNEGQRVEFWPTNDYDTMIAYEALGELYVDVEISGRARNNKPRSFTCKVRIPQDAATLGSLSVLCLDAITPDELNAYIQHRDTREHFLSYIHLFKTALAFLREERAIQAPAREAMTQALLDGRLCSTETDATAIVDTAIIAWRASNRGRNLPAGRDDDPRGWDRLMMLMYRLTSDNDAKIAAITQQITERGFEPLRLVLSGNGELFCYAAPNSEERDDRFEAHRWVHLIRFRPQKTSIKWVGQRWAFLPLRSASETVLREWDGHSKWQHEHSAFESYQQKQDVFDRLENAGSVLQRLFETKDDDVLAELVAQWDRVQKAMNESGDVVRNPHLFIPLGVTRGQDKKTADMLGLSVPHTGAFIYSLNKSEVGRLAFLQAFVQRYLHKDKIMAELLEEAGKPMAPYLQLLPLSYCQESLFANRMSYYGISDTDEMDPSIDNTYRRWHARTVRDANRPWLANDLLDTDGMLAIDKRMGIMPVDLSQQCTGLTWSFRNPIEGGYTGCFDIIPGKDHDSPLNLGNMDASGRPKRFLTREAALESMREIDGVKAIPADELPDLAQPKRGVERWYLQPVKDAQTA